MQKIYLLLLIHLFLNNGTIKSQSYSFQTIATVTIWQTATDNENNTYVLCGYIDTLKLANNTLIADHYGSHFIARYDKNGIADWAIDLGSIYYFPYTHLNVSSHGEVYLAKDNRYGPIQLSKISNTGKVYWTKNYGGSVYDKCNGLKLDKNGNIYMSGTFWYSGTYGNIIVTGIGNVKFIAKLNSSGECLWVKTTQ